jgi:hypothetical protein
MDIPSVYVGWFLQGADALVEAQSGTNAFLVYQRAPLEANAKRLNYQTTPISDLVQLPPGGSLEAALRAHLAAQQRTAQSPNLDQRFVVQPLVKSSRNPFQNKLMIGRAENNDVVIKLPSISKFHAWIKKSEGGYQIFDAQSTFGTFVGDTRAPVDGSLGLSVHPNVKLRLGELEVSFFDTRKLSDWLKGLGVLT